MPEPKKYKYDTILQELITSLRNRSGEEYVTTLQVEAKPLVREGTFREATLQIISKQGFWIKVKFFSLYPELFVMYLCRIKRPKS
jgi:hypothetical protein